MHFRRTFWIVEVGAFARLSREVSADRTDLRTFRSEPSSCTIRKGRDSDGLVLSRENSVGALVKVTYPQNTLTLLLILHCMHHLYHSIFIFYILYFLIHKFFFFWSSAI